MITSITLQVGTAGGPEKEYTFQQPSIRLGKGDDDELIRYFSNIAGGQPVQGHVKIDDPEIDEQRLIYVFSDGAFIVDEKSMKGTKLNGHDVILPEPIKAGDVIEMGNTKVVVKALDLQAGGDVNDFPPRYVSVRVMGTCSSCGLPLPINGLRDEIPCTNCGKVTGGHHAILLRALEHGDDPEPQGFESMSSMSKYRVWYESQPPKCSQCEAQLPVADVPIGTDDTVTCPGCGHQNSTFPAPEWFRERIASIQQVYGAERDAIEQGSAVTPATGGDKPIILSCPQCKGALKLGTESERTVTCEYCAADVYLPDDLWRKLHPTPEARPWFVRYQGATGDQLAVIPKAREEFEEIRTRMTADPPRTFAKRNATTIGVLMILGGIVGIIVAGLGLGYLVRDCDNVMELPEVTPTKAEVEGIGFSIGVPGHLELDQRTDEARWYDSYEDAGLESGEAEIEVIVWYTYLPESVAQLRDEWPGSPQTAEIIRAQQTKGGGFEFATRDEDLMAIEIEIYHPVANTDPAMSLFCEASMTHFAYHIENIDEADAYLTAICRSLTIQDK